MTLPFYTTVGPSFLPTIPTGINSLELFCFSPYASMLFPLYLWSTYPTADQPIDQQNEQHWNSGE